MAPHRPATSAMVLFWSNAVLFWDVCAAPAAENASWDTLPAAFWDCRGTFPCSSGPCGWCPAPVQFCRMELTKTSNTMSQVYVGVEGTQYRHVQL